MSHSKNWKLTLLGHLPQHGFNANESCELLDSIRTAINTSGLNDDQQYECIKSILDVFNAQKIDLKRLATNYDYKRSHFIDDLFNADVFTIILRNKLKHHPNSMPTELVAHILDLLSPNLNDDDTFSLGALFKESLTHSKEPAQEKKASSSPLQLLAVTVLMTIKEALKNEFKDTAKALTDLLVIIITALKSVKPLANPTLATRDEYGFFTTTDQQDQSDTEQSLGNNTAA